VSEPRSRPFVRLALAAAILVLAAGGWSVLRLREARQAIDALASETVELETRNRALRDEVGSASALRASLRAGGEAVPLSGTDASVSGMLFLDRAHGRALVTVDGLQDAASGAGDHRLVVSSLDDATITIPFDPDLSGAAEILLRDLPNGLTRVTIERKAESPDEFDPLLTGSVPLKERP
jgi:hypothetical protein